MAIAVAVVLGACSTGATGPSRTAPARPAPDPASGTAPDVDPTEPGRPAHRDGPYEVTLVADFGPLPDGSGDAVVETTWTVDATGTRSLVVDTPAGFAARHVMTDDAHWWWLDPTVRETIADAEWVHFDLRQVEAVGGRLPAIVTEARVPLPDPGGIRVGQIVAGHEVLAVDIVSDDEVHLTVAGVERAVVHRRRPLPARTRVQVPDGAVDVADLPGVLRW